MMIETKYDKVGDVAVVTMANPPANTFTMELGASLEGAVRQAISEQARALVLQADGPLFCGGADVHIFAGTSAGQAERRSPRDSGWSRRSRMRRSRSSPRSTECVSRPGWNWR